MAGSNTSKGVSAPVDPLDGASDPTATIGVPRKTVTPLQGIAWGEPVFGDDGEKIKATVKMRGRDMTVHAHDTIHAPAHVPVSVPLAVAEELLERGLAMEPDETLDGRTVSELEEALAKARARAADDPHTKIV